MNNAVLTSYNVSMWPIAKSDKKISRDIAEQVQGNQPEVGRFVKYLIDPKSPEWKAICRARDFGRKIHYAYTLPWTDNQQLLNAEALDGYMEYMEQAKQLFESAVNDFIAVYNELVLQANRNLSGNDYSLWQESDYPSEAEIRSYFSMTVNVRPITDGSQFKAMEEIIGSEMAEKMEEQLKEQQTEQWNEATREVWKRLYKALEHTAHQLSYGKRIHDSVIDNLQELARPAASA